MDACKSGIWYIVWYMLEKIHAYGYLAQNSCRPAIYRHQHDQTIKQFKTHKEKLRLNASFSRSEQIAQYTSDAVLV